MVQTQEFSAALLNRGAFEFVKSVLESKLKGIKVHGIVMSTLKYCTLQIMLPNMHQKLHAKHFKE